ncbi:MAG: FAD-binding oxidoreductase [Minwuia sp.]|nr:FAD-binding oxidoreductase [Minwuia sp.]
MSAPPKAWSYYEATVTRPAFHDAPMGDVDTDVCIVGGGLTGISVALDLAEQGASVRLVDAGRIGGGASGRNGGQINTGLAPGAAGLLDVCDRATAQALFALSEDAIRLIDDRVVRYRIDCDLARGFFYGAAKPGRMKHMAVEHAALRDVFGLDRVHMLDRAEAVALTGSDRFHGGLLDPGAGHVHSLKYCLGLARAAAAAGAMLHEDVPALSVDPERGIVVTPQGRIRAEHVVIAANAYFDGLLPNVEPRALGVGTWVMTTAPLAPEVRDHLLPGNECVCDDNAVLDYFRFTADNRLLFGGGVSYLGREDGPAAAGLLRRRIAATYPELADAPVGEVWGGKVSITRNRLPDIGRAGRRVWYAHGFSGQGVAITGIAGKLIAAAIQGDDAGFRIMSGVPHRDFPGGPYLRRPLVTLGRLWYRLLDRF